MKLLFGAWVMVMALLSQPAAAEPRGFGPRLQAQDQRARPREPARREQRDMRRDYRAAPDRHERRLTDEERRELRRDIDQANRDIYRRPRGR